MATCCSSSTARALPTRARLSFVNLYKYGGGFDMASALAAKVLPFDLFETRRLIGAAIGIVGLVRHLAAGSPSGRADRGACRPRPAGNLPALLRPHADEREGRTLRDRDGGAMARHRSRNRRISKADPAHRRACRHRLGARLRHAHPRRDCRTGGACRAAVHCHYGNQRPRLDIGQRGAADNSFGPCCRLWRSVI